MCVKSEGTWRDFVALPDRTTGIRLSVIKSRQAGRARPDNGAQPLPLNPGCSAEVPSMTSRLRVQLGPQIVSESSTVRPEPPGAMSARRPFAVKVPDTAVPLIDYKSPGDHAERGLSSGRVSHGG